MIYFQINILIRIGIIMPILYSCIPVNATYYENEELPVWTNAHGIWSLSDERSFIRRGYESVNFTNFHSKANKQRDESIINKYYLNGALIYAGIKAKNETTTYSRNPYSIGLSIFGLPNKHTSFTINNIKVNSYSGNDLANKELPVTIILEEMNSGDYYGFAWAHYSTGAIFNLKNESIIIEFSLEINGIDNSESGTMIFELKPLRKFGLYPINF
jgi:hypothetical protein